MTDQPVRARKRRHRFTLLLILAVLIALGIFAYSALQYLSIQEDAEARKVQEAEKVAVVVGKLIALPEGETPLLITVDDATIYRNEPIFARVKEGDQILVYTVAGKIVIYRPEKNIIVDAMSLDFTGNIPSIVNQSETEQATTTDAVDADTNTATSTDTVLESVEDDTTATPEE